MRYLITMTIDIEEVPKNAPVKKPAVRLAPEALKLLPEPPLNQLTYQIKEVAEVLGIGRTSIYYLMKQRKLPFVKLGRRTLVPVQALQAFLERIQNGAPDSDRKSLLDRG